MCFRVKRASKVLCLNRFNMPAPFDPFSLRERFGVDYMSNHVSQMLALNGGNQEHMCTPYRHVDDNVNAK